MQKFLLSLVAAALLLAPIGQAQAAEQLKPVVTVSFAGYDKAIESLAAIGRVAGDPQLASKADIFIKAMTQGKGITGLDTKRPWAAAVLQNEKDDFITYIFLPVTDLKQLIELAKANPALAEKISEKDGVYQLDAGPQPVYLQQKGEWAVMAKESEQLAAAPTDPAKLLGDLPTRYSLAVSVNVSNVPAPLRDQFLMMVRAGLEGGLAQQPGESDAAHALRSYNVKQGFEQLEAVINDTDQVVLGWAVDTSSNSTHLDVELTARTGSKLAERLKQVKAGHSEFAGFLLPDAAVRGIAVNTLTDADVDQAKAAIDTLRKSLAEQLESNPPPKVDAKVLSGLLNDVFDVLEKTVETKKKDSAVSVVLKPEAATVVLGSSIAEGEKLQATLKKFVDELAKADPEAVKQVEFKLNVETYEGYRINKITTANPSAKAAKVLGDKIEIVLAIANDKVAAAVGRDALKTLKTAIDQSKADTTKEVLPFEATVAATPIAKFVAATADKDQVKAMATLLVTALEKAQGKDRLLLTVKPIDNGMQLRIQFEEGILKAIGFFRQMQATGAMAPADE